MSTKGKKPVFEAVLSAKQADMIAGTIVRRAFESVQNFDRHIDDYLKQNIYKIVMAILGFEKDPFERGTRLAYDSDYSNPVSEYILQRAKAKVLEHSQEVLKSIMDDDFKALASKSLKKSVSERYDDAYKCEMHKIIKREVSLSQLNLEEQTKSIIEDGRRMISGAAKATIDLYIATAKDGETDDQ